MSWFEKILPSIKQVTERKKSVPEGLWSKCPKCESVLYRSEVERNQDVCPKCEHHMRINARKRLDFFFDEGTAKELAAFVTRFYAFKFK